MVSIQGKIWTWIRAKPTIRSILAANTAIIATKPRTPLQPLPEDLPREEILVDIPEEQKHCECGAQLVRIGEQTSACRSLKSRAETTPR
jgi:hypothetical protein